MSLIRLSKAMADRGLCSRREADVWIEKGWVHVDGQCVGILGSKVTPDQQITVSLAAQQTRSHQDTVLLNKPVGYVSGQAEGSYQPASVLITPKYRWAEDRTPLPHRREHSKHWAPAGRLDIDSTGLLVLTKDGRVAKKLIGSDSEVEKEYLVRVVGTLTDEDLSLLCCGLSLDGKPLKKAQVSWLNSDQLRFVLREGKKRQIRRMCELVGLKVTGLKRVRIGSVCLGNLPIGQWRYLGVSENF